MNTCDSLGWQTVFKKDYVNLAQAGQLVGHFTVHPDNLLPVFAMRVSNYTAGGAFVTLHFGFEDPDVDPIFVFCQLAFGGLAANGVRAGMLADITNGALWPVAHVPARVAIWAGGDFVAGRFTGTLSVHACGNVGK